MQQILKKKIREYSRRINKTEPLIILLEAAKEGDFSYALSLRRLCDVLNPADFFEVCDFILGKLKNNQARLEEVYSKLNGKGNESKDTLVS